MSNDRRITWWVPRWAFLPQLWMALRRYILNQGSLTRIVLASSVVAAAIVLALKVVFPGLVLPNLWTFVIAIPGVVGIMVLQVAVTAVIPPHVTLRNGRIQKSHGQSGIQIQAADFLSTRLYVHRDDKVRLKIRYRRRGRERTLVIGVAPTVDLDRLVGLLPIEPAIRDARSRSISLQNGL